MLDFLKRRKTPEVAEPKEEVPLTCVELAQRAMDALENEDLPPHIRKLLEEFCHINETNGFGEPCDLHIRRSQVEVSDESKIQRWEVFLHWLSGFIATCSTGEQAVKGDAPKIAKIATILNANFRKPIWGRDSEVYLIDDPERMHQATRLNELSAYMHDDVFRILIYSLSMLAKGNDVDTGFIDDFFLEKGSQRGELEQRINEVMRECMEIPDGDLMKLLLFILKFQERTGNHIIRNSYFPVTKPAVLLAIRKKMDNPLPLDPGGDINESSISQLKTLLQHALSNFEHHGRLDIYNHG